MRHRDPTRRRFLLAAAAAATGLAWPRRARAGVDVALAGCFPDDEAGAAARNGAELAADEAARAGELLGGRIRFTAATYAPAGEVGPLVDRLIAETRPVAVVGGLGADDARPLVDRAVAAGRIALPLAGADGAAAPGSPLVLRVAPSPAMRVAALGTWLAGKPERCRWHLVTWPADAALARGLRSAVRAGHRPLAGVTVLAPGLDLDATAARIAATRPDVVVVPRVDADVEALAQRLAAAADPPKFIVGVGPTEGLPGTRVHVAAWGDGLERFGASELHARYRARYGRAMDEPAWTAWMAVKLVGESVLRAGTGEPAAVAAFALSPRGRFDGHKGLPLVFDGADHRLRQPLYVVAEQGDATVVRAEVRPAAVRGAAG